MDRVIWGAEWWFNVGDPARVSPRRQDNELVRVAGPVSLHSVDTAVALLAPALCFWQSQWIDSRHIGQPRRIVIDDTFQRFVTQ